MSIFGPWFSSPESSSSYLFRSYIVCPIFDGKLNPYFSKYKYNPINHTIYVLNKPVLTSFDPIKDAHKFWILFRKETNTNPKKDSTFDEFVSNYTKLITLMNVAAHTYIDSEKHDIMVFPSKGNIIEAGDYGILVPKQGRPKTLISRTGPTYNERLREPRLY